MNMILVPRSLSFRRDSLLIHIAVSTNFGDPIEQGYR